MPPWGTGRPRAGARPWLALGVACLCLAAPAAALAFPGTDPTESPRFNTPDDPDFDRCEADNEEAPDECDSYFEEEFRAFGFSPDSANEINTPGPHYATGTRYLDCSQLDAEGRRANKLAEGFAANDVTPQAELAACLQIAGVRSDSAFKYSTGSPDVSIAILDTGVRWQEQDLKNKIALNEGELPVPLEDRATPLEGGGACPLAGGTGHDADGDGAINVLDYRCDSRVSLDGGDETGGGPDADSLLDGSDLIAAFSTGSFPGGIDGGQDDDGNGYTDDAAGWDFFDDDNDPFDASSCCSANGHGTGRGRDAAAETNNARAGTGMCPECQIVPLRVWDTFVVPIDNFAMGILYAAQNGVEVAEGAVGGLGNTRFAREVFEYADAQGMSLMMVSSDINSANHNYPTNYNEAVYVAGAFPDTAPNETCDGPGGIPGVGDLPGPPEDFAEGCEQLGGLLDEFLGIDVNLQPFTSSFFRNSNLTQYGGKADIVLESTTGSENTGQASGAAGLLASFGREEFPGNPLSGNEIRQLLTMTAEDVKPDNTGIVGQPDKASVGWDPHFGYGRVNLPAAMKRIADDRVPPEVQIDSPDWFAPVNADTNQGGMQIRAHIGSSHTTVGDWRLEWACGQDAPDSSFVPVPGASGSGPVDGLIGTIPKSTPAPALVDLMKLANTCNGEVANDAGRPAGGAADGWPDDPYPNPDPERHAFQIRLTAEEEGDPTNFGRYRKTLFAYRDDGNLGGWPKAVGTGSNGSIYETGSGGEVSPRLYDLDGDNELDFLLATTSGELHALHSDGTPVQSFNGGQPVTTPRYPLEENHPATEVPTPHESPRVPAIGDIDGDLEAEIVVTAGEHVIAWELDGSPVEGFEGESGDAAVDPTLSDECRAGEPHPCFDIEDRAIFTDDRGTPAADETHIKRGFFGSPALADLDCDGALEVVSGAMDQHLYAWDGQADPLPGFPTKLDSDGAVGAEIVTSPAIAELDGDGCGPDDGDGGSPEVIIATNEVIGGDPSFPENPTFPGSFLEVINILIENATGANPVYAVDGDGAIVPGWPVTVGVAAGDLLPLVLPGHDSAVLDSDGDGHDEVAVSAATSVQPSGTRLVDEDGNTVSSFDTGPANSPDNGPVINLADYSSVGDILGAGQPSVLKGGLTVNGAANLLAVNQNLPFSHVEQAWDPTTGAAIPGYPVATDDFQLVSQASIARVGGPGPGRQVLVGTGLYQLHAYGTGGLEPSGWPKFTGGWQQATPAVGDADGDGDLEVGTVTREGWSFLWSTGTPACAGSNEEWWTYHHDEHSSNNYGHDGRPPGRPTGLFATPQPDGSVNLVWTAPGDDWLCGTADKFRIIGSANPITKPTDGQVLTNPDPDAEAAAGAEQTASVSSADAAGRNHFAVIYRDEAGNWGLLRSATTTPGGGDSDGDGVPDDQDACPNEAGPVANNGCPDPGPGDTDGDGVPDATDSCPNDPGPVSNSGCPLGTNSQCSKTVTGTGAANVLGGSAGSDRILGRGGNDRIRGGGGNDCLYGQRGRDRIKGNGGTDRLFGGAGRDRLAGGRGRDRVTGGRGRDRIFANDISKDLVKCGPGRDMVNADPSDRLRGCEAVIVKPRRSG